ITADLACPDGALGNLLSHLGLWELALERGQPITVYEDDAIFNRNFVHIRDDIALPAGWHFITWGWNFDSIVTFELIPGVSRCLGAFQLKQARCNIEVFRNADLRPSLFRLYEFFGIVAYSISPEGASLLKEMRLPVGNIHVPIIGLGRAIPNADWSVLLNMYLHQVNAYISFPPLVFTPNDRAGSTVLRRR
ncbi:MAG: glycosyltransferase family 25 protein, partial [Xanthobacteraceae bacterium]